MKAWLPIFLVLATLALTGASPEPSLEWYAANTSDLVRITPTPLKMDVNVAILCRSTTYPITTSIHTDKFFDVYISGPGEPAIKTGKGVYPENTVILKRKYSDATGKTTELYTGMIKREKGYNPPSGDWEYFVISGDGKSVEQSGALTSCMQCHQAYHASDYVTREYLTESFLYHSKAKN